MRSSSAANLTDLVSAPIRQEAAFSNHPEPLGSWGTGAEAASSGSKRFPWTKAREFTGNQTASTSADGSRADTDPQALRAMNRRITAETLFPEKDAIIDKRNALVRKQYDGGLSKSEERVLAYLRWQLDRIDDAETGETFDQLETLVEAHEAFSRQVNEYAREIARTRRSPIFVHRYKKAK